MMAALRANSVHDWASHFLQALANEAESGEFDRALDGARFPGSGGLDQLCAIGAAPAQRSFPVRASLVPSCAPASAFG